MIGKDIAIRDACEGIPDIGGVWHARMLAADARGGKRKGGEGRCAQMARALDLDAFVAETMAALATDAPEVLVEIAKPLRANVGPGEHALVDGFNEAIELDPIPV